jgi:hypothetical protein
MTPQQVKTPEIGDVVVYDVNGHRTLGKLLENPSKNNGQYKVTDMLLETEHTIPEQQYIRHPNPDEHFQTFIVQIKTNGTWTDKKGFRDEKEANNYQSELTQQTRIISEVIRL